MLVTITGVEEVSLVMGNG